VPLLLENEKHFIHLEEKPIECLFYACIGIGMAKSLYHMPWKIGLRKFRYCLNFLPQARVSCIKYCLEYIIMAKNTTWVKVYNLPYHLLLQPSLNYFCVNLAH
jgi:hypothetical protein